MAAPFSFLRDKNDRAVVAWLVSQGVAKAVYPANSNYPLDIADSPIVTVHSHSGKPEPAGVFFSGVWRFQTQITVHARAARQPDDKNPVLRRVQLGEVFAAVCDALLQSSDGGQSLDYTSNAISLAGRALATMNIPIFKDSPITIASQNADMADYTCQEWLPSGLDGGNPRADGAPADTQVWKEAIVFESICCTKNVS